MNCEHKYVNMEDGTGDKFCVRCSKKAMQGQLQMDPRVNPKTTIVEGIRSSPVSEIKINIKIDAVDVADKMHEKLRQTIIRDHGLMRR